MTLDSQTCPGRQVLGPRRVTHRSLRIIYTPKSTLSRLTRMPRQSKVSRPNDHDTKGRTEPDFVVRS